jgi:hypothetical protein
VKTISQTWADDAINTTGPFSRHMLMSIFLEFESRMVTSRTRLSCASKLNRRCIAWECFAHGGLSMAEDSIVFYVDSR